MADLQFSLVFKSVGGESVRAELTGMGTAAAQSAGKLQAMGDGGAQAAQKISQAGIAASANLNALGKASENQVGKLGATGQAVAGEIGHVAQSAANLMSIGVAAHGNAAALAEMGVQGQAAGRAIAGGMAEAVLATGRTDAAVLKTAGDLGLLGTASGKVSAISAAAAQATAALGVLSAKAVSTNTAFNAIGGTGWQSGAMRSAAPAGASQAVAGTEVAATAAAGGAAATAGSSGLLALGGGYAAYKAVQAGSETAQFEKQIALISTLSDQAPQKLESLGQEIRKVSADLGVSAQTSAKAVYDIVSSGVEVGQSVDVLTRATKAAVAGETDVQTAANVGVSVLNSYGLGVDHISHVYDILFQTVNKGVINFPQLSQQLGDVLPIARNAGVSLEEVGAGIAALTLAGIKAPEAVTALKQAILQLAAPGPEAAKALDQLGIKWTGLESTIEQISKKNLGLAAIRSIVPDVQAANGVLAMSQNYEKLKGVLGEITNSSGAFEAAFQKLQNTDSSKIDRFNSALENLRLSVGGVVLEATPALESLTSAIAMLHREWDKQFGDGPSTALKAQALSEQYNTGLAVQRMGSIGQWLVPNSDMAKLEAEKKAAEEQVARLQGGVKDNNSPIKMSPAGGDQPQEKPYDYQGSHKSAYDPLFHQYEQQYKLPDGLVRAVVKTESNFDPQAISSKGAQGLGQLMPDTAKALGVTDPFNPEQNIAGTAKLLAQLFKQFDGDLVKVLEAYNAGPTAVKKAGGNLALMPQETQKYVPEVAKNLAEYGHLKLDVAGDLAEQKKLLDAKSTAQKAAIELDNQAAQTGLRRQEAVLKTSLDTQQISESSYYAQVSKLRVQSIDAEISSRRQVEALIRQQVAVDGGSEAAQIAARSQIAKLDQEINTLEAQRGDTLDEAKAKLTQNAKALVDQYDKIGAAQRQLAQQTQALKDALAQGIITPTQYSAASAGISKAQKSANSFSGPTSALDARFGTAGAGTGGSDSGQPNEDQVLYGPDGKWGVSKVGEEVQKTNGLAQQLGLTFTSAFENAIRSGNNFQGVLKGIASDVVGIVTRLGVTNPILNALSGKTGDKADPTLFSAGGLLSEKTIGSAVSGIKDVGYSIGKFFGGFFAEGGTPPVGKPSIVGERGVELFVPSEPGTIIPNHLLAALVASLGISTSMPALSAPVAPPQAQSLALRLALEQGQAGAAGLPGLPGAPGQAAPTWPAFSSAPAPASAPAFAPQAQSLALRLALEQGQAGAAGLSGLPGTPGQAAPALPDFSSTPVSALASAPVAQAFALRLALEQEQAQNQAGAAGLPSQQGQGSFAPLPFFMPSSPSTQVATNNALQGFSGGGISAPGVTQHISFPGGNAGGVDMAQLEARIRQATADGARQGYALMLDDLKRNGQARRLIGK